jgi:hypothetical protein
VDRFARAVARSEALVAEGSVLMARAAATREQSRGLRSEAMELRFRRRQLSRQTTAVLASAKRQADRSRARELTIPSAWSGLEFHLPERDLDSVLVAVG